MFTCPDKEIHSVYIDGELPPALVRDYEAHIASCDKCRKELMQLRLVHEMLQADKDAMTLDDKAVEQSYQKLLARKRYNDVLRKARPSLRDYTSAFGKGVWHVLPLAAAAAVVAVVLPIRQKATPSAGASVASARLISSGEHSSLGLSSQGLFDGVSFDTSAVCFDKGGASTLEFATQTSTQFPAHGGMAHRRHGGGPLRSSLGESPQLPFGETMAGNAMNAACVPVDIFRPDIDDNDGQTIDIRISVPGIKGERAYTTIRVPVDAINSINSAGE